MAYDGVPHTDSDSQLKDRLEKRLNGLRFTRADVEKDWLEVARFCAPRLGSYLLTYGDGTSSSHPGSAGLKRSKLNNKLLDDHAVWASGVLGNGMTSGLSSPSRPWFKITTEDPEMREFKPVKVWCDEVTRRIQTFFNKTNFYQAIKSTYHENGIFGTEAGVMLDHWRHGGVTHALTAGEYWVGLDDAGIPDALYRRCDFTALQLVQRFGIANCPRKVRDALDQQKYDTPFEVIHAMEPNDLRMVGKYDARNKRVRSVYFMCGGDRDDPPLLSNGGFDDQPFWAARWDAWGMDPYGVSPGMNAYADTRQLQFQSLRKQQAIDYVIKPALRGPTFLAHQNANLMPGRITTVPNVDKDVFAPIWQVQAQAVSVLSEDIVTTKQAVDRSFYVDLFMAITNMPGVQPKTVEEIARRNEEKLTQLGPVVERVNTEKLKVAIDRAFLILFRQGLIPPAPRELQGKELKIDFISVLAQMQRLVGLGSIERGVSFVGNIVGVFPEAGDKLDIDQAIDEYMDIAGVPASMVRSDDEVAKLRQGRAEEKAAMEQAAQMAAGASAAKDGAQAAQIMAQADAGGSSLLQRMTGAA